MMNCCLADFKDREALLANTQSTQDKLDTRLVLLAVHQELLVARLHC